MEKRLKWNAVGLEGKTKILRDVIKQDQSKLPPDHLKEFKKLQRYLDELNFLLDQMRNIQEKLIPNLEQFLRITFPTPELIFLALARPSIKNIYTNLKVYFEKQSESPLNAEEYNELAASGEAANVLALIGDAVLDLTVVEMLWDSSLTTVGRLTTKREEIVSNTNLAKVCEKWNLFQYRLKRYSEPSEIKALDETIEHEKATLVEAIFGVIYLEFGFQQIGRVLPLIQYS